MRLTRMFQALAAQLRNSPTAVDHSRRTPPLTNHAVKNMIPLNCLFPFHASSSPWASQEGKKPLGLFSCSSLANENISTPILCPMIIYTYLPIRIHRAFFSLLWLKKGYINSSLESQNHRMIELEVTHKVI